MKTAFLAIIILVLANLSVSLAWATHYWVATTGSDAISCATASGASDPGAGHYRLTPQNGAACLTVAGDRLTIKAGTYTGALARIYETLISVANGTPGNPTIIEGEGAVGCALTHTCSTVLKPSTGNASDLESASYITIRLLEFDGTNNTNTTDAAFRLGGTGSNVLFEDVEIHNYQWSGFLTTPNADLTTLRRVNSHNNALLNPQPSGPGHGIYGQSTNILIEYSQFNNNGFSGTNSNGMQLYDSVTGIRADNAIVRNTVATGNSAAALVLDGINTQIQNNKFSGNRYGITLGNSECTTGAKFYNNTISNNVVDGIQVLASCVLTVDVTNNLVVNNGTNVNLYNGASTTGGTNRTSGTLTDCTVSSTDFHLKAGAPCIDAGTTLASVTTDFDGVTRPQGAAYDIGAYEFAGGDITPPTAPSNLSATPVSGTQINLVWTASTDNVGVTSYLIERCQGAGCSNFSQVGTSIGTTFTDTGLTTTVTYGYRVRATDAAANLSGYSNTATATTLDTIAPTTPTGLVATAASSSQINLSWTGSTDNVAVTAYLVERCLGAACGGFAQITSTTNLSLIDTGLAASSIYRYRVRATDAANNLSGYSAIAQTTTLATDLTPPTIPTNLHFVSHTNSSISMAWTASTDNVAVAGYQVFQCQGSSCTPTVQVGTSSTTTFTDSPLPCLASSVSPYTYTVRAIDPSGNLSAQSAPLTATVLSCTLAPMPPSNVSLAAIADYSRTQITWTQAGAGAPDTYRMDCGMTSGNPTFSKVVTGITLSSFIKDVLPGQGQWFCVVVATTSNVDSSVSNEVVTNVVGPGFGAWGFSY